MFHKSEIRLTLNLALLRDLVVELEAENEESLSGGLRIAPVVKTIAPIAARQF